QPETQRPSVIDRDAVAPQFHASPDFYRRHHVRARWLTASDCTYYCLRASPITLRTDMPKASFVRMIRSGDPPDPYLLISRSRGSSASTRHRGGPCTVKGVAGVPHSSGHVTGAAAGADGAFLILYHRRLCRIASGRRARSDAHR